LLDAHCYEWTPRIVWRETDADWDGGNPAACTFRRGFVESVVCTAQAWLAYGREMVKAAPLREVRLSDKKPWRILDDRFSWLQDDDNPAGIPPTLFAFLKGDGCLPDRDGSCFYATEQAALKAMSDACLRYARRPLLSGRGATVSIGGGPPIPIKEWKVEPLPAEPQGIIEVKKPSRRRKAAAKAFSRQAMEAMTKKRK
jgi:hypothetical protein